MRIKTKWSEENKGYLKGAHDMVILLFKETPFWARFLLVFRSKALVRKVHKMTVKELRK